MSLGVLGVLLPLRSVPYGVLLRFGSLCLSSGLGDLILLPFLSLGVLLLLFFPSLALGVLGFLRSLALSSGLEDLILSIRDKLM